MPNGPDKNILARCLAIGPSEVLVETLRDMHQKRIQPKPSWAWFPIVLCDRIHGKRPEEIPCPEEYRQIRKQPTAAAAAEFGTELLNQVNGAARRMQ